MAQAFAICKAVGMKPSRTRTRMEPAQRRAQIIDVATRLISEGGFNTFTLSQLAAESGLTRAGVEHHFCSKEEVLIAVLRHRDELDQQAVLDPIGPPPLDRETLWASFAAFVHRNSTQREIVRLYTILGAEALDPTHPAHDYFVERFASTRSGIAASAREWAADPELLAIEVLGCMDGLQLQWLRDPSLDLNQLWARTAETLARSSAAAGRSADHRNTARTTSP